ncbi:hypothetical protein DXG03_008489 [Asterophora parasitica]|uniref:Guanine nucleotide-binding protein-like 1 n=1 Tax=Asterophora parasitica TaxID=117018 RepID=A0A9P7GDC0_9AGAR|nr:hypothetical protein DXG03_008489 [Asterophora parasitica]
MPPRRKPTSTRQKKADQQLKRAIKRGDVPAPEPQKKTRKPKFRRGPTGNAIGSAADPANAATIQAAKRLQSAFVTLPPKFLEETKLLVSTLPLHRPIADEIAIFSDVYRDAGDPDALELTCPRRPKWRFDMTKKEVEHNEEGVFKKWLEKMDGLVAAWQTDKGLSEVSPEAASTGNEAPALKEVVTMPRSPTYFERNLEVWRQLWRVTEISQILLVLLDSRCPLLHFPPSLAAYLSNQKVILVLTKVDISGPVRVTAWLEYFHKKYPHLRVVQVESYAVKEEGFAHQGKSQFEPHLPESFRERLVANIREAHAEMLQPPEKVKESPSLLKHWKPSVKQDIDWDGVLQARGSKVGTVVGGAAIPRPKEDDSDGPTKVQEDKEPELLTIGLIGLVMPNFVPMEMQVLCGILPISRVSAVPSCIHYASERIPIERVYNLSHPSLSLPLVPDKRTWREGMKPDSAEKKPPVWTAMDVLTAYADMKKWVTAKAGRPDIHRAGNAMLRGLAEGRVGWAFWAPDTDTKAVAAAMEEQGTGLWIPNATAVDEDTDEESENEEEEEADPEVDTEEDENLTDDDADSDDSFQKAGGPARSRFNALVIDDVEEEEEDAT